MKFNLKHALFGKPLTASHLEHEKLPVWRGLPLFSSDALSSVAYATEEILLILVAISLSAAYYSAAIAASIAVLLVIVAVSYRQTISLYPNGGGAYSVAKDNMGQTAGLVAGGALLIDYILTVAVSVSAGVAALTSAFPGFGHHEVLLGVLVIAILTIANLRGLRESSVIFSVPTYLFIVCTTIMIGRGLWITFSGGHPHVDQRIFHPEQLEPISWFVILKAFSSGCAALTGIEAISNGVTAFRDPAPQRAKRTLSLMVVMLVIFFLGVTFLSQHFAVVPRHGETVISQVARTTFGQGTFYYFYQVVTALILVFAANTAYSDFPRLASLIASDRFMPRQLSNLGDRLVFSNGIMMLGFFAAFLVVLFNANTHALVPLYSVGVFMSFTLSQMGMVVHHIKFKEPHWKKMLAVNLLGAITTAVVLGVVTVTKFLDGAWIIIGLLPLLIIAFRATRSHYDSVASQLVLPKNWKLDAPVPSLVVIPVSGFHTGVIESMNYAQEISSDVRVVVVDVAPVNASALRAAWAQHVGDHPNLKLVILPSPYRSVTGPLFEYMELIEKQMPERTITVVVPEFITKRWWHNFLHNQTALFLRARLRFVKKRVVVTVSYHLRE
ncbi:MAG TPA: APC family permease [Bdellovibrionota bacterium]|jgi:amino acid transporter|nr:APC family permease [Bdellovibrionota bacterium]